MKGNNTLELNTATMIEAMQEYFDKRMGEFAPRVVLVECGKKYDHTFLVSVSDREDV